MTTSILAQLGPRPKYLAGCCAGLSTSLLDHILSRLPKPPELVLSIGSGSGLLEALLTLRAAGTSTSPGLNLCGVEVVTCDNRYLPSHLCLRVSSPESIHHEAMLASALIFAYPRAPPLVARYMNAASHGAVTTVIWLGHQNDWPDFEHILRSAFMTLELLSGHGISEHELLAIASGPIPTDE